jgi:hypothetical protein
MVERFMDFNEYVREYELSRGEGTLLRYLSDAYRALVQTVPAPAKPPEVEEIEVFLRAMVRAVDSSLLDEWERMRQPDAEGVAAPVATDEPAGEARVTEDERAFTVLLRNALFQLVRALARKDWAGAAGLAEGWTAEVFERHMASFYAEHEAVRLDPSARAPNKTNITKKSDRTWGVVQVLCDTSEEDDWALSLFVDLDRSDEQAKPVLVMRDLQR